MVTLTRLQCSTNTNDHKGTSLTCLTTLERSSKELIQESYTKLTKPHKTPSNSILQGPKMKPWLLIPIVEY
jgi:hypothetical protein